MPNTATIARSVILKASWRTLPLLGLAYLVAFIDRANITFAATQMNADLGFSATVYGIGVGIFYVGYSLFEIPSNLLMMRVGPRRWIARIMVTWGLIAAAMMFVTTAWQFYTLRLLLGVAEAGLFPCIIYYLSLWFPRAYSGRATSRFYVSLPVSIFIMGAASGWLLGLDGAMGLQGWQWLFLVQGLPACAVGLLILTVLPDRPEGAKWLDEAERAWLLGELRAEAAEAVDAEDRRIIPVLRNSAVLQLAAIMFLSNLALSGVVSTFPIQLGEDAGISVAEVGYLVSAGGVGAGIGMLIYGWISDRAQSRFTPHLWITIIVSASLFLFAFAPGQTSLMFAYFIFAASWTLPSLAMAAVWPDILTGRALAIGAAAINTISQVGGIISPILWGISKDATGSYFNGMLLLQIPLLISAILIWKLRRQLKASPSVEVATAQPFAA